MFWFRNCDWSSDVCSSDLPKTPKPLLISCDFKIYNELIKELLKTTWRGTSYRHLLE